MHFVGKCFRSKVSYLKCAVPIKNSSLSSLGQLHVCVHTLTMSVTTNALGVSNAGRLLWSTFEKKNTGHTLADYLTALATALWVIGL